MAKRRSSDEAEGRVQRVKKAAGEPLSAADGLMLAAVVLLAACLAPSVLHLGHSPAPNAAEGEARALAARIDAHAAAWRAGLSAGGAVLQRPQAVAAEAAQITLTAAGGPVKAVAVAQAGKPVAVAGDGRGADWNAAIAAAARAGPGRWSGAVDGRLFSSLSVKDAQGQAWLLLATVDPERLFAEADPTLALAVAPARGGPLAIRGEGAARDAADQATAGGQGGPGFDTAEAVTADGALRAVAAVPKQGFLERGRNGLWALVGALGGGLVLIGLAWRSWRMGRAERRRTQSENRSRLAVEAARCGIWEWDLKTDQVHISQITSDMFGLDGAGVVPGPAFLDRIAPDHRDKVVQALGAAAVYGAFDVSFRVPDPRGGRALWIDARGQGVGENRRGEYARIIGVALDVTQERVAQARAQAAESRLRDAIESVSEAFALWDRNGRLLMCNRNYRLAFSLDADLLKPGALRDQINFHAQKAVAQEHPSADGLKGMREVELVDGRWLQISERRTAEGGLVLTAADITAIKQQEEARRLNEEQLQRAVVSLERSQEQLADLARKYEMEKVKAEGASRAKSEFLANMSHELRTPLNAVNGFSEIMLNEMFGPLGDPRYKGYVQDIHASGQHLLALIDDILDMAKIEAGKMNLKFEPMNLSEVTQDSLRLIRSRAEAAGLKLIADLPPLPEVEADYRAIKQVLLNLLSNAIKFTPRGGTVTVKADMWRDVLGQKVRVRITDTGIGIASDDLKRLMRPFEQVEHEQHAKTTKGTGLGLAITKSLVELHDGTLELTSAPGQGTTVGFVLPVRQGLAPSPRPAVAATV